MGWVLCGIPSNNFGFVRDLIGWAGFCAGSHRTTLVLRGISSDGLGFVQGPIDWRHYFAMAVVNIHPKQQIENMGAITFLTQGDPLNVHAAPKFLEFFGQTGSKI